MAIDLSERNMDVQDVMRWFEYEHLTSPQREFSQQCHDLAVNMVDDLPDSQQLTLGLHKLLEAKDCFVRATIRRQEFLDEAAEWDAANPDPQVPVPEEIPEPDPAASQDISEQGVEYGEDLLAEPTVDEQIAEQTGTDAP